MNLVTNFLGRWQEIRYEIQEYVIQPHNLPADFFAVKGNQLKRS